MCVIEGRGVCVFILYVCVTLKDTLGPFTSLVHW